MLSRDVASSDRDFQLRPMKVRVLTVVPENFHGEQPRPALIVLKLMYSQCEFDIRQSSSVWRLSLCGSILPVSFFVIKCIQYRHIAPSLEPKLTTESDGFLTIGRTTMLDPQFPNPWSAYFQPPLSFEYEAHFQARKFLFRGTMFCRLIYQLHQ